MSAFRLPLHVALSSSTRIPRAVPRSSDVAGVEWLWLAMMGLVAAAITMLPDYGLKIAVRRSGATLEAQVEGEADPFPLTYINTPAWDYTTWEGSVGVANGGRSDGNYHLDVEFLPLDE